MRRLKSMLPLFVFAFAAMPYAASAYGPDQTTDPTSIVQAQVDAFNAGDADRFASFYADDVELFDLGANTAPTLSSRAALLARYKPLLSKYHPKATITTRIVNGSFIIDDEKTEAGGRASNGVVIYQVENGKIRRVWFTP